MTTFEAAVLSNVQVLVYLFMMRVIYATPMHLARDVCLLGVTLNSQELDD